MHAHLIATTAREAVENEDHRDGKVPGALVPSSYGRKDEDATTSRLGVDTLGQCRKGSLACYSWLLSGELGVT